MKIPFLRNSKYVYWSVGVFALFLSGCIFIYSPHSGIVVEKGSGLPIEDAILVRSWDRGYATPAGATHSWLATTETITDENGKFSFWPRILFSGIPLIMWSEQNSFLIYRPGYGFTEIKDLKNVIELPKISFNRNTRSIEANKAQSSYSTDFYKTELLKAAVQQEEKLFKELPEPNVPDNIGLVEQQAIFYDYVVQLLGSKTTNDRFMAEIAITKIGRLIVPALIKALGSSDDIHLRKAAAEQLGRMPWETNVENALIKALQDRNPLVVAYAAYALGEQRVKSVLGPLKILTKKESLFKRRGAIWAIAKIGSIESITFLKEFTNDKDEYVRMIAKRALENSGI